MSTIIIYAVIALSFIGALGGIYAKGYYSGKATVTAEWQAANEKARAEEAAKGAKAATTLEVKRAATKIVYRTIREQVDKIVEKPVYSESCFDARGLCIANAAILGKSADSCLANPAVPRTTGTRGLHFQGYLALDHGERGVLQGLH